MNKSIFPDVLKHADIKPIYKKESRNEKENYRPVRFHQVYQNSLKVAWTIKKAKILSKYHLYFGKCLVHSTDYQPW